MGIIRSVFVLLVGAALATFLWSNYDQRVVIAFTQRFRTVEISLSSALVGALILGFLLAVAMSLPNQFRMRRSARELRKTNDRLERELAELRQIPLSDVSDASKSSSSETNASSEDSLSTSPNANSASTASSS